MKARHVLIPVLLLLVVASGWFLKNPGPGDPAVTALSRGPDMFAEQIDVTVMDESGKPAYRIMAAQMHHSPDTARFELTRPVIEVKRHNGENWNIASERGQMTDKGDQLWFLGKVDIQRRGENPMQIHTSDVLVKPDEELAETDKAVSISAARYEIDAIGLKADFRNKLLEFRSRVHGTFNAPG